MAYNYLDFIRDQYRRTSRASAARTAPISRMSAAPRYSSFVGDVQQRGDNINPNPLNPLDQRPPSAFNPTPARQAATTATTIGQQLNDGDARAQAIQTGRNVLSASGNTYFPGGGYARTTRAGSPVASAVSDFSNPVISAERAAEYSNAASTPSVNVFANRNPIVGPAPNAQAPIAAPFSATPLLNRPDETQTAAVAPAYTPPAGFQASVKTADAIGNILTAPIRAVGAATSYLSQAAQERERNQAGFYQ